MLRREHEQILRAIQVALEVTRYLEQGRPLPPASLSALQQFFLFVAHRSHHDKEEELLFPLLRDKGFAEGPGCIGALLDQHEHGAEAFERMVKATEAYAEGDRTAAPVWIDAARKYVEALRQHIRREEEVLLLNAERLLTDADQQALAQEFSRVDQRAHRAGLDEVVEDFERVARAVDR